MLADPKILRLIIADPGSTDVERSEAQRVLGADPSKPSSRRRGRHSNVPQTQADQDQDITTAITFRPTDTASDRIEIEAGMDESTRAILAAFGSALLWLFDNNAAEIQLLIDLHGRTQSDLVRLKTLQTIRWIAHYSPNEAAKNHAQQFIQDQPDQGEPNQ
jgi:hypothetical protein